ncbi:pVI [Bat mastadenovirus]|uniref:Pre-protein VI n=1 Tax=Bat mastadenovirus TaxID=740971 RepID=A0A3G9EJP8_9ADEN|nr:pVI [Bat mastadenovirus]BBE29312.1 pVI [Bat mastadenovirus]
MDAVNFSVLAPRYGTHPMMSSWSGIGTSGMNGGAFNWGGLWSGIKNFGNSVKTWGSKAWNSQTGKMLRQKLNDTKVREKLVEGISTGVHGALDIANQEIAKQIEKRLERREPIVVEEEENILEKAPLVVDISKKRPRDEELIITSEEPPSYEEALAAAPLRPMTKPHPSLAKPVLVDTPATLELKPSDDLPPPYTPTAPVAAEPVPVITAPAAAVPVPSLTGRRRGWQGTLANIVGVGIRGVKRRRCY